MSDRAGDSKFLMSSLLLRPSVSSGVGRARLRFDPLQNGIRNLNAVAVMHEHVAVALHTQVRRVEHFHSSVGLLDSLHIDAAVFESVFPGDLRESGRRGKVVAKNDERRYLRQDCDLLVCVLGTTASTRFHGHDGTDTSWA